ncbi:MAG: hypothetical protein B6D61_09250 [Bacteroidetes bacterium 4484_249]|nr:MAG: hypothetical protein B6D61_09250 [Bacteroidetes bacterium 4484_249]
MRKNLIVLTVLIAIILASCQSNNKNAEGDELVTEESLGLRKTDLYSEAGTEGDLGVFDAPGAGTSQNIERSFENAPPLIPHSTEGLLPIKKDLNLCLTCHLPKFAEATKSTPIPKSHFMSFRPEITEKDGKTVLYSDNEYGNSITEDDLGDEFNQARFNCSQCHVPQANITVEIENTFKPDFRNDELRNKSNFAEVVDEGFE